MLQKDSFFKRREETSPFRTATNNPSQPATPETTLPPAAPRAAEPAKPGEKAEERKEAKLIVGPDIKMKGVEITDCDTLVVEGRIEATLDSRVLQIAEKGVFCGTVAVDSAEIHGKLEGELTVRKHLLIHATGKVSGKVRYARIKIEEGAEVQGDIGMLERSATAASPLPARRSGTA